ANGKVLYRPEWLAGQKSVALKGQYTPREAGQALLEGTSLTYSVTEGNVILIQKAGEKPVSDAVGVERGLRVAEVAGTPAESAAAGEEGVPKEELHEISVDIPEILVSRSRSLN